MEISVLSWQDTRGEGAQKFHPELCFYLVQDKHLEMSNGGIRPKIIERKTGAIVRSLLKKKKFKKQ